MNAPVYWYGNWRIYSFSVPGMMSCRYCGLCVRNSSMLAPVKWAICSKCSILLTLIVSVWGGMGMNSGVRLCSL